MVDVDTFRALARSSPWLWSSVKLTRSTVGRDGDERVRAWVRRPGLMRVEREGKSPFVVDVSRDLGRGRAALVATRRGRRTPRWPEFYPPQHPRAPRPVRRPDGLVERRPDDVTVVYDDPMYLNYLWVAMLDPVELADGADPDAPPAPEAKPPAGIDLLELEETERLGRPTVAATVLPSSSYSPRCTCCALLFNDVVLALMRDEGAPMPDPVPEFADAHRVQLDRQTGICVSVRDLGGDHDGTGYDVVIEEVDAEYPGHILYKGL